MLLCPWNSPGKNIRVGCHSLLQGTHPTQRLNLGLQDWRQISFLPSETPGKPLLFFTTLLFVILSTTFFLSLKLLFTCSVMPNILQLHGLQHIRLLSSSPSPRVCSNSCPLSQWCHPTILPSVVPFSSCLQSFPASGSFQMSQLFTWGGQSIGVSASPSVLPMNTQDLSPSGWTGWISLQHIKTQRHHFADKGPSSQN